MLPLYDVRLTLLWSSAGVGVEDIAGFVFLFNLVFLEIIKLMNSFAFFLSYVRHFLAILSFCSSFFLPLSSPC